VNLFVCLCFVGRMRLQVVGEGVVVVVVVVVAAAVVVDGKGCGVSVGVSWLVGYVDLFRVTSSSSSSSSCPCR